MSAKRSFLLSAASALILVCAPALGQRPATPVDPDNPGGAAATPPQPQQPDPIHPPRPSDSSWDGARNPRGDTSVEDGVRRRHESARERIEAQDRDYSRTRRAPNTAITP